jgi:hypothetical protein
MSGQVQGLYRESGSSDFVTQPGGLVQKKTIKAGAGKVFYMDIVNTGGGDRYVYVFDNTTDSGNILLPPFKIAAGATLSVEFFHQIIFSVGFTVATSTTQATYTAGAADFMMRVLFK